MSGFAVKELSPCPAYVSADDKPVSAVGYAQWIESRIIRFVFDFPELIFRRGILIISGGMGFADENFHIWRIFQFGDQFENPGIFSYGNLRIKDSVGVRRIIFIEIVDVQIHCQSLLPHIAHAAGIHRGFFGFVQCREQHSRQNGNDRNNDEEFDKRKPLRFALQI